MTSRDFVYWLQGFFEISETNVITEHQAEVIKKHLNLVFYHEINPSYTDSLKKQSEMNAIHQGEGAASLSGSFFPTNDNTFRC